MVIPPAAKVRPGAQGIRTTTQSQGRLSMAQPVGCAASRPLTVKLNDTVPPAGTVRVSSVGVNVSVASLCSALAPDTTGSSAPGRVMITCQPVTAAVPGFVIVTVPV